MKVWLIHIESSYCIIMGRKVGNEARRWIWTSDDGSVIGDHIEITCLPHANVCLQQKAESSPIWISPIRLVQWCGIGYIILIWRTGAGDSTILYSPLHGQGKIWLVMCHVKLDSFGLTQFAKMQRSFVPQQALWYGIRVKEMHGGMQTPLHLPHIVRQQPWWMGAQIIIRSPVITVLYYCDNEG